METESKTYQKAPDKRKEKRAVTRIEGKRKREISTRKRDKHNHCKLKQKRKRHDRY